MKKFFKYLMVASIIAVVLVMIVTHNKSIADVGSFEDYDSGSSWDDDYDSGSSWDDDYDSGSSWDDDYDSGSSWDDDHDSGSSWDSDSSAGDDFDYEYAKNHYSGYYDSTPAILKTQWSVFLPALLPIGLWIIMAVCIVKEKKKNDREYRKRMSESRSNIYHEKYEYYKEENVEKAIKQRDEEFDKGKLLSWASNLFIKMQETWTTGDWSQMRLYETNELYEQHLRQIQGYIDRNQMNIMDKISVQSAKLADFYQTGDKDILTVSIQSKMLDYIVDKTTGKVLKGDKTTFRYGTYKMEFIRKTGVKTSDSINTVQCPNCGAKTQITVSGKCEYCGSVLTTGEYNWALSNLERIG